MEIPGPQPLLTALIKKMYCNCIFEDVFLYVLQLQRAKKVLSDSPGLVDFAIGLVNSVFNLPDGQVMVYEEFE